MRKICYIVLYYFHIRLFFIYCFYFSFVVCFRCLMRRTAMRCEDTVYAAVTLHLACPTQKTALF